MSTWAYGLPAAPEAKEVGGLPQRSGICSHISCWGGERAWDAPARMCTPQARNAAGPCARAGSRSGDHPAALRPSRRGTDPAATCSPHLPEGQTPASRAPVRLSTARPWGLTLAADLLTPSGRRGPGEGAPQRPPPPWVRRPAPDPLLHAGHPRRRQCAGAGRGLRATFFFPPLWSPPFSII